MRNQVYIILNEREPLKAKVAEQIGSKLGELGITTSRIDVDESLVEVVTAGLPQLVVMDYLLGDFTTGLDLLEALQEVDPEKRPQVLFFTDEPSVHVAVAAMRLGALNYYELENPQSVGELVREVDQLLSARNVQVTRPPLSSKRLSDLIAHSQPGSQLIEQARATAINPAPISVIVGPPGSGRRTVAEAIHLERTNPGPLEMIDTRTFDQPFRKLIGSAWAAQYGLKLGQDLSVIVRNAEQDQGELLQIVSEEFNRIWGSTENPHNRSFLTICTSCEETASAWKELTPSEIIRIPSLSERTDDIPTMVQTFVREAEKLSGKKITPFDAGSVTWLTELEWPQQVKELRSVVLDAAFSSTFSDRELKEILEDSKTRFEQEYYAATAAHTVDPFVAASMIEFCNHNYRIAAARLGVGIQQLIGIVGTGEMSTIVTATDIQT